MLFTGIKGGGFVSVDMSPYVLLKKTRERQIENHQSSTDELNLFHDKVMKDIAGISLAKVEERLGAPPCRFSWFVMGSAGRFEQGIISDQDHGLIYEEATREAEDYFRELGCEVSKGLHTVGYPFCEGQVMSSNPVWCMSKQGWSEQVKGWLEEESFESVRFLLILFDARVLIGRKEDISQIKQHLYAYMEKNPAFLGRLLENTLHVKKGIGLFRQLLPETHGLHAGSIDLKHLGFFPFVNAARLFAIKEKIEETSTLSRLKKLTATPGYNEMHRYRLDFERLLQYRLKHHRTILENYDDIHYLPIKMLDKTEKKEIKQILMNGQKLQEYTKRMIRGTNET
jgi:CBS domain-containing protein